MGPVWEANHVWLVFVLVICWTAYPDVFASIFSTLTVPLFIAAVGIILRGTAYAARAGVGGAAVRVNDRVFSVSSVLTPAALGAAVGGVASGRVPVGNAAGDLVTSWLNPTSIAIGVLAVATGAYLAAVYLAGDAARAGDRDLVAAFRRRALGAGLVTGALAVAALVVVTFDAEDLGDRLFAWPALAAVIGSGVAGISTLELVRRSRFEAARFSAAAAVAAVVVGWALAQRPDLLPGLTIQEAAAGRDTLIATIVGVAGGAVILAPSLALLYGLVLRGRFDREAGEVEAAAPRRARRGRPSLVGLALVAGVVGLPLTLVFHSGVPLAVGVALLLTFVALAWIGLASRISAVSAGGGEPPERGSVAG
jgi:cytochrome d ubiquinol oxidase subunit II